MGGFDVTRIALCELEMILEEMRECKNVNKLNELYQNASDCLSAYHNSLLAQL